MTFFGPDLRNGLPIGLGSVAGFGIAPRFSPASLFAGGINGAWYDPSDSTTLFSDRAGTTPCAAPGAGALVPVGAMLDERAPAYSVYFDGTGDFLTIANQAGCSFGTGDFTVEAWVYPTANPASTFWTIVDARSTASNIPWAAGLRVVSGTLRSEFFTGVQNTGTTVVPLNAWTHVAFARQGSTLRSFINGVMDINTTVVTNLNVASTTQRIGGLVDPDSVTGNISNVRIVKGTAVYTGNFTPPTGPLSPITGTSLLTCGTSWSGNPAITKNGDARVDGLNPFQASPVGNHAIAANDTTACPELSARVNLLTYSEQFDNAAWGLGNCNPFGSGSVANTTATLDPLGGNTADYIQENTATSSHLVLQAPSVGANVQAVFSVYMKAAERTWGVIYPETSGGAGAGVWFNLATGVVGTQGAGRVGSITSVGNGWYRCSVVATLATDFQRFYFGPASADNTISYTGTGTSGIYIWGADLRPANIGTTIPAYQRVADQYTYDTVGFPRYLAFNGTSSAMSTPANVNLSGTDKATVFAGVRKLSNAAAANTVTELSATLDSNNGTFGVFVPNLSDNSYSMYSRGTIIKGSMGVTAFVAPISNVFTGETSISDPYVRGRVNGTQTFNVTTTQGTGNFGSYPLYIGARNNASLFLNGSIYSLIVAGTAVSASNITATEQWIAGKTGITI